ncbi:LINE-1 retrotransposable element ORF2 protein [Nosema granulosis]|uniref:LINE-1 retrotransposable element ORF2 protein n=1 Tax=Nosema granulosis TaxID=83296 RepID=A0A9P6GYU2_9MICR|nr:LINE-1 retrotransposable element ORF2 protein [Nosema granulosis]
MELARRKFVESVVVIQMPSIKKVDASCMVSFMTFNINGLRLELSECALLLKYTRPTIVCLQETLVKESAHRTWIPHYQTIETRAKGGSVSRGMALSVMRDSGLDLSQYYASDWLLVVLVTGSLEGNVNIDMLVINTYIPCSTDKLRSAAKQELSFFLKDKATRDTWTHVLLAGDFNTPGDKLDRLLVQSKSALERVPLEYNGTRWSRQWQWSSIDHLASKGFECVSLAKPLQTWDISDHFPVTAEFKIGKIAVNKRGPTISKAKVKDVGEAFMVDPKWEAVMGCEGNLTTQAEAFIASVWEVARGCKAVVEATPPKWRVSLSKETKKLIAQRRSLFKHIKDPNFDIAAYKDLWSRVRASKNQDACEVRSRRTRKICEMAVENRYKDLWREINSKESDDLSNKPIINDTTGELIHNKIEKEKMKAQHFGDLASDHTGHSRYPEYWVDKFPIQRNVFPECDDPLTLVN